MKRLFVFFLTLVVLQSGFSQQPSSKNISKKGTKLYQEAMLLAEDGKYKESIQSLQQALTTDPQFTEAYLSIAGLYGELKDYDNAIKNYDIAKQKDSLLFKDYNLPYSINLAGKGRFDDALHAVNSFLTIENLNESGRKAAAYRRKTYLFAIEYAKSNPVSDYQFQPVNMGDSVNSNVSEYYPSLTIDGKELIYTRRVNNMNEDFFVTDRSDGAWHRSHGLSTAINTNMNEGAQNISEDGQWLIYTGCNFPEGYGSCDLYISYQTPEGWSQPENLGSHINTEWWETAPCLSPDKRDLYFASKRPDGFGGSDLYVSHRTASGKWSDPENLGPEINTPGDESSPFMHADNQTLYFTSNGHPGYGGDDLFMVRKGPKQKWSQVRNLGFPINTIENEGSLVITADGKTAFYASDRSDSRGGLDLYSFELRPDVRPVRTLWVKGRVLDNKTSHGLPSAVELTDLQTREVMSRVQTDETGNYLITLPVGRDYAFNVNRRGYLFYSENFPLSQKSPDSTYDIDIRLQPIEANATVVLKNIFFPVNRFDLQPESQVELDNVVRLLGENPTLRIQINGHTDNAGKPADNLKLSNSRAQAVVNYLVSKGIDVKRLSYKGFGETVPVADNSSDEGRARNRRTELKVISQ